MMEHCTGHPAQSTQQVLCLRCGTIDTPTSGEGSGPHTASLRCGHCHQWLCWASTKPPGDRARDVQQARQAAMAARPPSQKQLDFLKVLKDPDAPPTSMLQASERIEALRGEVQP